MSHRSARKRQRAVRLTDDALRLLEHQVAEAWAGLGREGKVTRAGRAGILDVGVSTAVRIFARTGNDKAVLKHAFERVGLAWDDSYCEPVSSAPNEPGSPQLPLLSLNHGLRTWAGLVLAVIATTLLIALALGGMCTLPDHVRLNAKGREAYDEGDYPSALQWAAGALAASHGDRDGEALADALKLRGDVLAARGDLEKAIEVYRQTLPHWKAFGHREGYSAVLESLGVAEARLGLIDQAEARFKEALETAQGLPPEIHHAGKLRGLGSIAALRGDTATANRWYAQASHLVASRPEEATHVGLKALRALTLSQDGRHAQALDDLYECLDYWQSKRHLRWMANTFLQMAVVLTAIGDTRQARAALERSRELYSQATDARGARLTAGWLQRPDLGAGDPAMLTEAFF